MLQARRPLFSVYSELWQQVAQGHRVFRLRSQTVREILCSLALMPLRFTNLRASVHERVTASDASSCGGRLVASAGLTDEGISAGVSPSALVFDFVRRAEYRGSDVRLDTNVIYRPSAWPRMSIRSSLWKWLHIKALPFHTAEHINVLELRMYLFSLR